MKKEELLIVGVLGGLAYMLWKRKAAPPTPPQATPAPPPTNYDYGGVDFGVTNPGSWG